MKRMHLIVIVVLSVIALEIVAFATYTRAALEKDDRIAVTEEVNTTEESEPQVLSPSRSYTASYDKSPASAAAADQKETVVMEEAAEEESEEEKTSALSGILNFFAGGDEEEAEPEDVYQIVCIGNSVTAHPYVTPEEDPLGYWLQTWGMAASAESRDYSHVLASRIGESHDAVDLKVCNYQNWEYSEAAGQNRDDLLFLLEPFVSEDTDLIVLQLGENVTAYNLFHDHLTTLIGYLREHAPNAVIAVTGTIIVMDTARNAAVDEIKRQVCLETGTIWIDMSGYNESMWVGQGTQIVNPDGQVTIISLNQRTHPGDYGMEWIADQIYQGVFY